MFITSWWVLRVPVLLLIPSLFFDVEIIILIASFLLLHFTSPLKSILNEYLHDKTSKILITTIVRLSSFELLRHILELLI